MFIESKITYKSLEPIQPPIELPDFVVLSGLNGAGKSQLLAAISQNSILLLEHNQHLLPVKLVSHNTLAPNGSTVVTSISVRQSVQDLSNKYLHYKNEKRKSSAVSFFDNAENKRLYRIIQKVAELAGKDIDSLNHDDFFYHWPLEDRIGPVDIFGHNFSALFLHYYIKQYENDVNQFRSQKYDNISYLSDEEFLEKYGEPPWLFVNKIISEANLDYHINSPEGLHPEAPFQVRLINNLNGAEVNFEDLSSGEKVIMSLALSLYNANLDIEFPKVLLMDEPESHLHPSMTKKFLDVIQNVFVRAKGVKVVMTTHSPSTVALAPEESLFLMNKTAPRITKTTKDNALRILTSGVPTLSINYENRRQVFVESKHDVVFYEKVYEKLRSKLIPEISINFISSGIGGSGNCEQVKEIVNTLVKYGNRSIFGIIDWDRKNTGSNYVKVLGGGERYSIENYIFDPILLAAFLLREKFIDRATLGLSDNDRYTDFNAFDNAKLQSIANFIVCQVKPYIAPSSDTDLREVEYVGGHRINLPTWFLTTQGHELESLIKKYIQS